MKFKLKIKFKTGGKILYITIILLIAGGLILTTLFIYQNIQRAVTYSEQIISLKQEIAPESFNVEDFNQAINHLDKKQDQSNEINWSEIKNPFRQTNLEPIVEKVSPARAPAENINLE